MAGGVGLLQSRRYIAIRNQESDQTVINLVSHEGLHVNVNFASCYSHLEPLSLSLSQSFSKFEIKYEHSFVLPGENGSVLFIYCLSNNKIEVFFYYS